MVASADVIIAGGGTAGHTNPGIATAEALVEMGLTRESILFVGGSRGSERELVEAAGFRIMTLPGRGVQRKVSLTSLFAALSLIWGVLRGIVLVARRRPKVVVCLGGYAALPASVGAIILRRPIVVSEQNSRASAVNRFVSKYAKVCALPFPDTDLPNGKLTGNPVRNSITAPSSQDRLVARKQLGIPADAQVVAVWSGSLGARSVNDAVSEYAASHLKEPIFVYHIVGRRDYEAFVDRAHSRYRVVEYETDMKSVLHAADLAICRSGASTVGELAVASLPSLLVPLPGAPRDHQTHNAAELVDLGAARLVKDSDLTAEHIDAQLSELLLSDAVLQKMRAAATQASRPNAATLVAELTLETGGINVD